MYEDLKSQRIPTRIIEFKTDRPKKGRRGSPAIPEGTTLYAIQYLNSKGGYFTYSYLSKEDAESSAKNQKLHETDNEYYYLWNVVKDIQDTVHVSPRKKK